MYKGVDEKLLAKGKRETPSKEAGSHPSCLMTATATVAQKYATLFEIN